MTSSLRVTGNVVNVRAAPTTAAKVIGQVRAGATVTPVIADPWRLVRTADGLEGWVHGGYLTDAPAPKRRAWRVARALDTLLEQANAMAPHRDTGSDGDIGDAEHAARDSDHNPADPPPEVADRTKIVRARDITHDPAHGCDAQRIVDKIVASRDRRASYLIFNGRIWRSYDRKATAKRPFLRAWEPEAYTGPNPHTHHFHLSVVADPALYDDETPWRI